MYSVCLLILVCFVSWGSGQPAGVSLYDRVFRDCVDVQINGLQSGVYKLASPQGSFAGYCDMDTDGGGWLVFQKRFDGSIDFERDFNQYVLGFGDLSGEFWLGLDRLHSILNNMENYHLRIDLEIHDGRKEYAKYSFFNVGPASLDYQLGLGIYSGNAGDSLRLNNGMKFSTKDRDNDKSIYHCAKKHRGAWWYGLCWPVLSNLNAIYAPDYIDIDNIYWADESETPMRMKSTEMKLRRDPSEN